MALREINYVVDDRFTREFKVIGGKYSEGMDVSYQTDMQLDSATYNAWYKFLPYGKWVKTDFGFKFEKTDKIAGGKFRQFHLPAGEDESKKYLMVAYECAPNRVTRGIW